MIYIHQEFIDDLKLKITLEGFKYQLGNETIDYSQFTLQNYLNDVKSFIRVANNDIYNDTTIATELVGFTIDDRTKYNCIYILYNDATNSINDKLAFYIKLIDTDIESYVKNILLFDLSNYEINSEFILLNIRPLFTHYHKSITTPDPNYNLYLDERYYELQIRDNIINDSQRIDRLDVDQNIDKIQRDLKYGTLLDLMNNVNIDKDNQTKLNQIIQTLDPNEVYYMADFKLRLLGKPLNNVDPKTYDKTKLNSIIIDNPSDPTNRTLNSINLEDYQTHKFSEQLSNINLDDIDLKNGNYIVNSITSGTLPQNVNTFPIYLEIRNDGKYQILVDISNPNNKLMYYRIYNGTNWEDWSTILLSKDIDPSYFTTYSRLTVATSLPNSPLHGELYYNNTTNKLYKYNQILNIWLELDWRNIITESPEYQANRLRVNNTTGKLEISPDGSSWYECIPAVGNKVIELMTFDNSYSYKYWIAPGQIVIIRNANHIPIVYAKDIEPFFDGAYWYSYSYDDWIGIRPSNISISNGDIQYMAAANNSVWANRLTNLSIVPIADNSDHSEDWANFVLRIRNNQKFLSNAIEHGNAGYFLVVNNCSGTASSMSYWLGPWYTRTGVNFQLNVLTLTRRA